MKIREMVQEYRSENAWDKLLRIKTTGRDDTGANNVRYAYEPTPYSVLERLAVSNLIGKKNTLLDYGAGKGRVSFFLAYETGCRTLGVEINERLYEKALKNQETAVSASKTTFFLQDAASFDIPGTVDRVFFFNPFSLTILRPVMGRLKQSWKENPREILLFFYFPAMEYVGYLMQDALLEFEDEIDTSDLFYENPRREKILIFKLPGNR